MKTGADGAERSSRTSRARFTTNVFPEPGGPNTRTVFFKRIICVSHGETQSVAEEAEVSHLPDALDDMNLRCGGPEEFFLPVHSNVFVHGV